MKDFTVGKESKLIFQFAIPILLASIFHQMYNVVDSIFIGKFVNKEGLVAIGASFPVIFATNSLVIGIASGATVVIAQYFGAKQLQQAKRAIDSLYIFLFFSSIIIGILGIIFAEPIFSLINMPIEAIQQAVVYLRITMAGNVLFFGLVGTNAILRGIGDSKTPLLFTIIASVINIALDWLFIVHFKWDVAGAAFASIIAQGGAFFTGILYLNKTHELIRIQLKNISFSKTVFMQNMRIGLPTGFQQAFVACGMMALYGLVNSFGTTTGAAYAISMRIEAIEMILGMSFSAALASFTGQNLGAQKIDRIQTGFRFTIWISSILTLFITALYLFFPTAVVQLFSNDPEVIEVGIEYIHYVAPFYIIFNLMFIVHGLLRGAGATLIPMILTLISLWVARIPASYFMVDLYGRVGIWWGIPIGWSTGMLMSYIYYRTGKWKNKGIVKYS